MTSDRDAWEAAYRQRGRLWGRSAGDVPDLAPGSRVLELGCGNGRTLAALLQRGLDVVSLDFSASAVAAARHQTLASPSVRFLVADARYLPFRDASFDAVFAWHLLGHLNAEDRIRSAREIQRLLVPGGIISFADFSRGDFRYGTGRMIEDATFLRGNSLATHYFTEDEVRSLFPGHTGSDIRTEQWSLRVRGSDLRRSEIRALFTR